MESKKEQKAFSIVKRAKSFSHAFRGLRVLIQTQHNAWVQIFMAVVVIVLGFYFSISSIEWMFLTLSIGLVIAFEAINTAIEFDIDLTSPEFHPYARDTKDVAAGAVLLCSLVALIIGLIIFVPKIILFF